MALATGAGLLSNPQSPAQLRAVIAALRNQLGAEGEDLATLQSDIDDLEAQASPVEAVFDETLVAGEPIRVLATTNVTSARANSLANANVAGMVFTAAASTETGSYVPDGGRVDQSDWTSVTGSTLLTAGSRYFLSATAGQLTTTAPTTTGQVRVKVGRALTTTTMQVEIGVPVLL